MGIFEKIEQWLKDTIYPMIEGNLKGMFDGMNDIIIDTNDNILISPQEWGGGVLWNIIKQISTSVIVPIAVVILALIMYYEFWLVLQRKNAGWTIDIGDLVPIAFKFGIAIELSVHLYDILTGIFSIATYATTKIAGLASSSATMGSANIDAIMETIKADETLGFGNLIFIQLKVSLIYLAIKIISSLILVIVYGRLFEICIYSSVAAIPLATTTLGEQNFNIGKHFLKNYIALALQGVLLVVIMAIFAKLVGNLTVAGDIDEALGTILVYAFLLGFMVFKSGQYSKSIMAVS